MENNNIQYEGGDVLIRTTWDSTDFFLVHRHVLSKRSTYFRALLGDHWNKPRALNLNGEGAQIWSLYLKPDMKDLAHVTFVLSSDISTQPETEEAAEISDKVFPTDIYENLFSRYHGRDGHRPNIRIPCLHNVHHGCLHYVRCGSRQRAMEIHRCILDLIYGKVLQLPDFSVSDLKMIFLADLIYFADFYDILDVAASKIEQALVQMEDLHHHIHNSPLFFLEIGYYLRSKQVFLTAMSYKVGKHWLEPSRAILPDSVLEFELEIADGFSKLISKYVRLISRVLAFQHGDERSYGKKAHPLNEAKLKTREVAKTSLMNWVTRNFLQILCLGEDMNLPSRNWQKFTSAVGEQKADYLPGIDIARLSRRYSIHHNTLKQAIEQQLQRLSEVLPLGGSCTLGPCGQEFEMLPCELDNCRKHHDFYIAFRNSNSFGSHVPWETNSDIDSETGEIVRRDIEEHLTKPASDSYLAFLGLTVTGRQRQKAAESVRNPG